jgi:hypothetical protein
MKDTTRMGLMAELDKVMVKLGLGYSNLVSFVPNGAHFFFWCKKWPGGFNKEENGSVKELTHCS